jgi:Xaa-Pro dipeptidase
MNEWAAELESRRAAVQEVLERHGCDAGLVFGSEGHAEHFRYLTNFVPVIGDMWAILAADSPLECVLNFTWQLEEARRRSGIDGWSGAFHAAPLVAERLAAHRPTRVAVASLSGIPVADWDTIRARLRKTEFVEVGEELAQLRRRKSELEITLLREAARVTDVALEEVRAELRPGVTEKAIAARLEYILGRNGASSAFFPCVVSGVHDPIPIRLPTERRLERGDTVMIDMGAEVEGYQADASRTFVLGTPSADQQRAWAVVEEAYEAALALTRPGTPCLELERAARAVIEEAGYGIAHRVGHGIGLATSFEWPSLDSEAAPLEPGVTICIEPGVYAVGAGNMKLEDDVLITEDGHELLTQATRTLELPLA